MTTFSLKFETLTPDGEMNFIGAAHKYFDQFTDGLLTETKDTYIQRYENYIFPYINPAKPVSEYSDEAIADILIVVKERSGYKEISIDTNLRHLIYDPCECYFKDPANMTEDNLWGSAYRFNADNANDDADAKELTIRKSFTVEEEKRAAAILNGPETDLGEYFGLAFMFYMGTRNNETCGVNYGDIKQMTEYPECEYVQIYETVKLKSNELKAGGKTYNAPRRLPLMPVLKDLLHKRMKYIESKITFPYQDENGNVYQSILDLPIACCGQNYTRRCKSDDLSKAGREFLHAGLRMHESEVSGLSYYIQQTAGTMDDLQEKDVTTYLLRRNMATHLYTCGFSMQDSQYYMGHCIDGTDLNRSDFSDEEYLHSLYIKLLRHPLNAIENLQEHLKRDAENSTTILDTASVIYSIENKENGSSLVKITNHEIDDPIQLRVRGMMPEIIVCEEPAASKLEKEINISKQIRERYKD